MNSMLSHEFLPLIGDKLSTVVDLVLFKLSTSHSLLFNKPVLEDFKSFTLLYKK